MSLCFAYADKMSQLSAWWAVKPLIYLPESSKACGGRDRDRFISPTSLLFWLDSP